MHRFHFVALALAALAPAAAAADEGFTPLFNGRNLDGWVGFNSDTRGWSVREGLLRSEGQVRNYLLTDRLFDDYELRLEYRLAPKANSGVILRGLGRDDTPKPGLEVQVIDDESQPNLRASERTGALHGLAPATVKVSRPAGEWNTMRIIAVGARIRVDVNGTPVLDANLDDYADQVATVPGVKMRRGRIGLQSWDGVAEFRTVAVKQPGGGGDKPAVVTVAETAQKVGERVTVEFTVRSVGNSAAGLPQLYSEESWRTPGCFFVRFTESAQAKFAKAGVLNFQEHFRGRAVRVTGKVKSVTFKGITERYTAIEVEDVDQIAFAGNTAKTVASAPALPAAEPGFERLFNGRDLTGWVVDGPEPESWKVEGGELVARGAGYATSNYILTQRDYGDMIFRGEFKLATAANSGLTIRAVPGERQEGRRTPSPIELQLIDDSSRPAGDAWNTGSLNWSIDNRTPRSADHAAKLKPVGEWNTLEVEVRDQRLTMTINGEMVQQARLDTLASRPGAQPGLRRSAGRIGFQRHTGEVRFRNLRVKPLGPTGAPIVAGGPESAQVVLDAGGHTASVQRAVFTPDGRRLVSVSDDKTVRVWDVATGRPERVFWPPTGTGPGSGKLYALALSPDGRTAAVAGYDGSIRLIDLVDGRLRRTLRASVACYDLAFSPDGKTLASAHYGGKVAVWNADTGAVKAFDAHKPNASRVVFAPDGSRFATTGDDGVVRVWSVAGDKLREFGGSDAKAFRVSWSPDGKRIATGAFDGQIRLWDETGREVRTLTAAGKAVADLQFTPDSRAIVYAWNEYPKTGASVIDAINGNELSRLEKNHNTLYFAAVSPDGRLAATGGGNAEDLRLWKTADGTMVHQLRGRGAGKWAAGWTADGQSLAWGNGPYHDRPTRLNDFGPFTASFRLTDLQKLGAPSDATPGPKQRGDVMVERDGDSRTKFVFKANGTVRQTIDVARTAGYTRAATLLGRGERVVFGGNFGLVSEYDTASGKPLRQFEGHTGTIWGLAPSPDGRFLLSASHDETLKLWDLHRGELMLTLFVAGDDDWIAWTPEGYYAASPGGEQLAGWLVTSGPNELGTFLPMSHLRGVFYRPDVIRRLLEAGNLDAALVAADRERGGPAPAGRADITKLLPPKVRITRPDQSGRTVTSPRVEVEATAEPQGGGAVTALRLLLDGRPVGAEKRPGGSGAARATWEVELPPGPHQLTVRADSGETFALSDSVDVTYTPAGAPPSSGKKQAGKLMVLAVGINNYPGRLKLDCAAPDAKLMAETFLSAGKKLFRDVETKTILDDQATREGIRRGLAWLKERAKSGDVAVVFFAGHGDAKLAGELMLLPVDAQTKSLKETGLSGDELRRTLGELPCTVVLILDACYSGSIDAPKKRKTRSLDSGADAAVRELAYDSGLVVLCGVDKDHEAIEAEEKVGHGFFTSALAEALSGKADLDGDGEVDLDELFPFVRKRVRAMSDGEQEPTISRPSVVRTFSLARP
jgi:WD40 repeat protein